MAFALFGQMVMLCIMAADAAFRGIVWVLSNAFSGNWWPLAAVAAGIGLFALTH